MVRYLVLINFTEQGIRDVKETVQRAEKFRQGVEAAGGKVLGQYWALGPWDGAVLFEAPDETAATALLLSLGRDGNVRTQTLRIFDAAEVQQAIERI